MNDAEHALPWATWRDRLLRRQCRARRELRPGDGAYSDHGRCELRQHGGELAHALERGMYAARFTTDWADPPDPRLHPVDRDHGAY